MSIPYGIKIDKLQYFNGSYDKCVPLTADGIGGATRAAGGVADSGTNRNRRLNLRGLRGVAGKHEEGNRDHEHGSLEMTTVIKTSLEINFQLFISGPDRRKQLFR